jgi:hypothetical protein
MRGPWRRAESPARPLGINHAPHLERAVMAKTKPAGSKSIDYHCGKIIEATYADSRGRHLQAAADSGIAHVQFVEAQLVELFKRLRNREPKRRPEVEGLRLDFELVKHALAFLANHFASKKPTPDDRLTARIFAAYMENEVPDLVNKFRDLDGG